MVAYGGGGGSSFGITGLTNELTATTAASVTISYQAPAPDLPLTDTCTSSAPAKTKGGTVTCTAGTLAAGDSVTVTIQVTAAAPGTISDGASVTAGNVTADSATATTTVQGT